MPQEKCNFKEQQQSKSNKTLCGALTRWGYIQIRTLLYMITHDTYSTQLFQLRFKVFPELSGKVENERERLNTVLKCGRPYLTSKVIFSTLHPSSRLSAASWSVR
jgi:dolichol kinase